jgi:formate dehydrogenase major subunit
MTVTWLTAGVARAALPGIRCEMSEKRPEEPSLTSSAPARRPLRGMRAVTERLPLVKQALADPLALGRAARSRRSAELIARTADADKVVASICPYCAVGCGQKVYVKDERVIQIEGDPDSPISRGRLCPKGAVSRQLHEHPRRERRVKYRRPGGTEWEELELEQAMDMIAERLIATRAATWEDADDEGRTLHRTQGFAHLGGATLDNEENYLIKKGFSAMGAVQIENQARI